MAQCVMGMQLSLWKRISRTCPGEVYMVLKKRLRRSSACNLLVRRLMMAYELSTDEAIELLMTLHCLLEDCGLYPERDDKW